MNQQDKVARYGLLVSTASGILGCVLVMYGLAVDIVKEKSPTSCSLLAGLLLATLLMGLMLTQAFWEIYCDR
jgi:hypothetical protein